MIGYGLVRRHTEFSARRNNYAAIYTLGLQLWRQHPAIKLPQTRLLLYSCVIPGFT